MKKSLIVSALVGTACLSMNAQSQISGLPQYGATGTQVQSPEQTYRPGGPIVATLSQISCVHKIPIPAQADGLIQELLVEEGSVVKKGQTILIIDSRIAAAELKVAEKQLESAEILAKQVANIEFSKKARDLAYEEYNMTAELYKTNAANYSEVKRKRLEAEKSKYSIDMALDEQKKHQLDAVVAQEQVNASKVKLDMYEVKAPYDGIIVERKRDLGEWIRAGEPVVRLVHMQEMKIEAFVSLSGVAPSDLEGAEIKVEIPIATGDASMPNYEFKSRVSFVSPEIDSKKVRVVGKLQNQKDVNGRWVLRDGMPTTSVLITPR